MFLLPAALAAVPLVDGPWEHAQVQTRNLNMHVLVAGPEDAPAVLLLHGFPDSSHGWRHVLPALAQDHRVYAPDLRGYGNTEAPEDGYALPTLADDVVALMDALSLEQVDLIGHDWGAAITWEVASVHPERFRSITVLNIPHPTALRDAFEEVPAQQEYKKFANLMKSRLAARILANIDEADRGEKVYFPELVNNDALSPADITHYHALLDEVEETRPPLSYYRVNFKRWKAVWEKADAFPKVAVPALVLWGEQDSYMLASEAERSCGYVSARCATAIHPDAGHWLSWEQPEWIVEQWQAFVAQ